MMLFSGVDMINVVKRSDGHKVEDLDDLAVCGIEHFVFGDVVDDFGKD